MADSYSVKAILSAKDSGFSSTLKSCSSTLDTISNKINGFSFGILTGVGQAAFGTLKNGVSSLISEIDSSNAAWKTFEGNMGILGKGTKEIDKAKKSLQEYAQQSVYSSSDMASTYAQLEAVGTKSTLELVKSFGGLAAASENPQQAMKTLSQQATQMAAKPTVAWQDFKLMLEQTPAGISAVAKEMGMSASDMVQKVQAGEIATDKFFEAIIKAGGAGTEFEKMATTPKTVGQAMDGLTETIGNKLTPAFDMLSQKGIGVIGKLSDKLGSLDATMIADKVSTAFDKVQGALSKVKLYWDAAVEAFSGVGSALKTACDAVKSSFTDMTGGFASTDDIGNFKGIMQSVADVIKKVAEFATKHSDAIAKLIKWLPAIAIGLKGFSIAKTVAPGVVKFAGGIAKIASSVGGGIASKLFGLSKGQKEVGKTSKTTSKQMLASAKAFMMIGAGVLMVAIGFGILAVASIALANAGWGAIAVMVGMVGALVGLGIGMAALMKSLAPMSKKLVPVATAFLAMGAAVLLIAVGFAIMAAASIALANAGWGAIAVMVGMVAVIALLAVGAALLGTALTAGAIGFIAFGAAVLMVGAGFALLGVGALLAATALQMIVAILPMLCTYGLQGALSIAALGASMYVFAIGAGLAGVAALILGAGLLVCAAAVLILALGVTLLAGGILIAAAALSLLSLTLPTLAQYGTTGAIAILALSGAMAVFAIAAGLCGIACIVLGAGLLVCAAAVLVLSIGVLTLAAGVVLLGAGLTLCALAFTLMAATMPIVAMTALLLVASFTLLLTMSTMLSIVLVATTIAIGAMAIAAGGGAIAIGAFGIEMAAAAIGSAAMVIALKSMKSSLKSIASNAKTTQKSLKSMNKSVDAVKSGLDAIGNKAKSAMNKLTSAFDSTEKKSKTAGKAVGTGFTSGMQSGLLRSYVVANTASVAVSTSLMAGRGKAFSAGAYIGIGFAQGMLSQLAIVKKAATQLAAQADKAVRAKAKIKSPSRIADKLGSYWGEGLGNGIIGMAKYVWNCAQELVSIPNVATPNLAYAYAGELSSEYEYTRKHEYNITVVSEMDGKKVGEGCATYVSDSINKQQTRANRKHGKA